MKTARMLPLTLMVLASVVSIVATHAAAGTAEGKESAGRTAVPFHGVFEGRHASRTPLTPPVVFDRFEAQGKGSHLGRFELVIEATVDFGVRPVKGAGTYTFTAANGDRLVADHTGSSALVRPGTVLITEHAVIDPDRSTGRFAGAEGEFTVERLADAATGVGGVTSGTFEGTISLAGKRCRP